jgi:N-methylhydantoinase A
LLATGGNKVWRIGVDTGGTFTDGVAIDEATGRRAERKTSSTPDDPARACT